MPLILDPLSSATQTLEALAAMSSNTERMEQLSEVEQNGIRAGVIQHFKVAYELSRKLIERWLQENLSPDILETRSRRDIYRLAAERGLIHDVDTWDKHHKARIQTSHFYDGERALELYRAALEFAHDARFLLRALEAQND